MPLPTFLIVGVPRAGTTSLAAYLAAHPDVFVVDGKELHFFNGRHVLGLDWYKNQFVGKPGASHRGEATPGYLFKPEAVAMMARTVPDAKLIVVLRNPVDRAYSHFWLNRWRGIEPLAFDEALLAEVDRHELSPNDPRRAYFQMGAYQQQLTHLLSYYDAGQVCTVLFEELQSDPAAVMGQVCAFLGVSHGLPSNTGARHNHHGPVRSVRVAQIARQLPGPLCRTARRLNTRVGEYPTMPEATRRRLEERFRAANLGLADLIGRQPQWSGLTPL